MRLISQFVWTTFHFSAKRSFFMVFNLISYIYILKKYLKQTDNWLRTIFDRDFCIDDLGLSELSLIHDDNAPGVGQTRIHQSKREEKFMVFSEKASSLLRKAFMSTNHMRTAIGLIPSSSKLSSNERHKPAILTYLYILRTELPLNYCTLIHLTSIKLLELLNL